MKRRRLNFNVALNGQRLATSYVEHKSWAGFRSECDVCTTDELYPRGVLTSSQPPTVLYVEAEEDGPAPGQLCGTSTTERKYQYGTNDE